MNVRVRIRFESPGEDELASMRSLTRSLTNHAASVRVFADEAPGWPVAEFTMPTEAQYAALPRIEREIRLSAWNRLDVRIGFPMSEAEQARARRKAERRRSRRRRAT